MESLGKIFGSVIRVKIMRLFLFNEKTAFDVDDVTERSRVKKPDARKELTMLAKIGFLKKKTFTKKILKPTKKKDAKSEYRKKKVNGWILNTRFDLVKPLQKLLLDSELIKESDIAKRIKKSGTIKFLVLSGLFMRDEDRKLDVLIVGEKIKKDILEKEIAIIESEIGHELRYTFFTLADFEYRISMYDKLVRDVLESDHITIIDKR
ncbi:MAG: hypothetical protein MRY57_01090 [Candidatus Pacebacteria bacterium]|nr:hypothetical protein [Candidatus Paceibacterota bacterium]